MAERMSVSSPLCVWGYWTQFQEMYAIPEKIIIPKDTCTPTLTAALFTTARTRKQPRWPLTDAWIKKLWYIYTMEYYSAMKKSEFESVELSWTNLEC